MFPFKFEMPQGPATGAVWMFLVLMTLVNFLMGVFWLVLGWRAMRAHERLPDALAERMRAAAASRPTPESST